MKSFFKKTLGRFKIFFLIFTILSVQFFAYLPLVSPDVEAATDPVSEIKSLNDSLSAQKTAGNLSAMISTSAARKTKLSSLITTTPEKVAQVLISDPSYPAEVQVNLEKNATEVGVVRSFHGESATAVTNTSNFLYKDKDYKSSRLEIFAETAGISPSWVNSQVTLKGWGIDNKLWFVPAQNIQSSAIGAAGTVSAAQTVSGARTIEIYYVNFLDNTGRSLTDTSITDYVFGTFKNFITKSSSNRVNISGQIIRLDLPINKTCNFGTLMTEVTNKAGELNIFPQDYSDNLIFMDPNVGTCFDSDNHGFTGMSNWGPSANGPGWMLSIGMGSIAHEFGHEMGLSHAGTYDCTDVMIKANCPHDVYDVDDEYGNKADVMGAKSSSGYSPDVSLMDYGGYGKEFIGWLNPNEVVDGTGGGTFKIYNLEDQSTQPNPYRVLKVNTFIGGPNYYIQFRKKVFADGPTLELASGTLAAQRKTYQLDSTPGSNASEEFTDGIIHDGQEIDDPYNGFIIRGISHDASSATVQVIKTTPGNGGGSVSVSWGRPVGYLSAIGQKKDISWPAQSYQMSHRCTSGFGCDPNVWVDDPVTTNHNGSFLVARSSLGYAYEYKVILLTVDDNNPQELQFYPWVSPTAVSNDCGGQGTSCTIPIFWPQVTYNVDLRRQDNLLGACTGIAYSCSDSYAVGGDTTTFMFRGLPKNVAFNAAVRVNDINNNPHMLKNLGSVGTSDSYEGYCVSINAVSCDIYPLTFSGVESIDYSVKLKNSGGVVILGPTQYSSDQNGGLGLINWSWDYVVTAFPKDVYANCFAAGSECQVAYIYGSTISSNSLAFAKLRPSVNYAVTICAKTCNPPAGQNSQVISMIGTSSSSGPTFFTNDPFVSSPAPVDSDYDGFSDIVEIFIGTNPNKACSLPGNINAWPVDYDNSGKVEFGDFTILLNAWNASTGQPKYNKRYDLAMDGKIDFDDFSIMIANWNKRCS